MFFQALVFFQTVVVSVLRANTSSLFFQIQINYLNNYPNILTVSVLESKPNLNFTAGIIHIFCGNAL